MPGPGIQPAVTASQRPAFPPVVVGGGPAATGLAVALAARGLRPTVVVPGRLRPSEATLCAFADELPSHVPGLVEERFERTVIDSGDGLIDLGRPYARVSSKALVAAASAVADVVDARAVAVEDAGRVLRTDAGPVPAGVVIDATGHTPALRRPAARSSSTKPALQAAWGIFVDGEDDGLPPGTALFMDWTRPDDDDDGGPPSFLYALSFADGRLLLEETSLAARPAVSFELLERRLRRRLRRRGTRVRRVLAEERVLFPMQGPLPAPGQPVAAFGAALGLVQPVTGFSVARSLRVADVVADAVVAGLAAGVDPTAMADAAGDAVWTPEALARRRLQLFGLDALCAFDADDARAFFRAFFALPRAQWTGFLDGTLSSSSLRRAMLDVFGAVPPAVRLRLLRGGLSPHAAGIARDLLRDLLSASPAAPALAPGASR